MSGGRRTANKEQPKESDTKTTKEEAVPYLQWDVMPLERLEAAFGKSVEELQSLLSKELGLTNTHTCIRESALLHYYIQGLCWAQDAHFSPLQTSFTMAVLHILLHNITEKTMALVDNVLEFAKTLAAACQCPYAEEDLCPLLSPEEAQVLISFITDNLFQNYQLYEALLSSGQEELLLGSQRTVEVLSLDVLAMLEEGIPTHLFPSESLH